MQCRYDLRLTTTDNFLQSTYQDLTIILYNTQPYYNKSVYVNPGTGDFFKTHVGQEMQFIIESTLFLDADARHEKLTLNVSELGSEFLPKWLTYKSYNGLLMGVPLLNDFGQSSCTNWNTELISN